MRRCLLSFLLCLISVIGAYAGTDTTRVLFIGNSFTYVEDVPGLVKNLALKAGRPFEFFMHAPGGISVGDVAQGTNAHMNNPLVYDAIRSRKWDFVVIQDNQGRFVDGGGIFPAVTASKVVAGHLMLRDSIRHYWPCARTILFSGWAWKDGYPGLGNGEDLIRNIWENYRVLNDTLQEIIAPIGSAWLYSLQSLPLVDLWSADLAHQSLAGSYVTANVLYATIFRSNPQDINYDAGLDIATALELRRIGYRAVLDSINRTGLSHYIPAISLNGSQLTATPGASFYDWFHNGAAMQGNTNTIPSQGAGIYQVIAHYANGCSSASMELVTGSNVGVPSVAGRSDITIFPNPVQDRLTIRSTAHTDEVLQLTVTDLTGHTICSQSFHGQYTLPVGQWQSGMYALTVTGAGGRFVTRFNKN